MNLVKRTALWRLGWFGAAALLGGGCDLQTKTLAESALATRPGNAIMLIAPWLELKLAYNRGTAFSIVQELGAARFVFGVLALLTVIALGALAKRWRGDLGGLLALGAIAAAALGNGIDRMFRAAPGGGTGVVDFIKLNYPWGGSWPIFNVADVLVTVGVAYLLLGRRAAMARPS